MSNIAYSPKAQSKLERLANAARWSDTAAERPDNLLWQAAMVAAAAYTFIFVLIL